MNQPRLFSKNQELELTISDLAFGGTGIARYPTPQGDLAIFVENVIPGQRVLARVSKVHKRHVECKLVDILEASREETAIPFQRIPGAPYATWPIERQHASKQRLAIELYRRIGKIEDIETRFDAYLESPDIWHYRNKMEYSFSSIRYDLQLKTTVDDFALGFKHRGTWWIVENLDQESGLFDEQLENNLHRLRDWCRATGLPAWHPPQRHGFFRYLVARKSFSQDQILLNLVTTSTGIEGFNIQEFVGLCQSILGDRLAGVLHTINDDSGDRVDPLEGSSQLVYGRDHVTEEIHGLQFAISMKSFFQTNPNCAAQLYQKAMDYLFSEPRPSGHILDLFCGTGTITQLMAKLSGEKVTGVDIVESAIRDARENARRNGVSNVDFIAADVGRFLNEFPHYTGTIDSLVLDPPRAGIIPKTLGKIIALGARRIVYISCNPATQARDALTLADAGYGLTRISFVDQFPHTAHLEAVALFEKNT